MLAPDIPSTKETAANETCASEGKPRETMHQAEIDRPAGVVVYSLAISKATRSYFNYLFYYLIPLLNLQKQLNRSQR